MCGMEEHDPLSSIEIFNSRTLQVSRLKSKQDDTRYFVNGNSSIRIARDITVAAMFTTSQTMDFICIKKGATKKVERIATIRDGIPIKLLAID